MSGASLCAAYRIVIGDGVLLGANVIIADTDFHPTHGDLRRYAPIPKPQPSDCVTIEENVFVGANAIILKGVQVGRNSVIGAGSIVTRDVPRNTIVAGNPARPVGTVEASRDDK
ncbi:DapH/DapD/GlmU-related protein [Rhodococcus sp. USK10]|uniref:DapH/DapD/GlmU-related protein n=1 Tax=Rhodococcus sp. USK10 TaxID=2789739 RepID=UPI0035B533B4